MSGTTKSPKRVAAGQASARARWGWDPEAPRVVALDELTPAQRRLVMALVEAARQQNAGQA